MRLLGMTFWVIEVGFGGVLLLMFVEVVRLENV